jgi:hypothetical protein
MEGYLFSPMPDLIPGAKKPALTRKNGYFALSTLQNVSDIGLAVNPAKWK